MTKDPGTSGQGSTNRSEIEHRAQKLSDGYLGSKQTNKTKQNSLMAMWFSAKVLRARRCWDN